MILLTRGAPVLLEIGLLVFCLVDCLQADPRRIRTLRRGWWIAWIVILPFLGGIAWLALGRPARDGRPGSALGGSALGGRSQGAGPRTSSARPSRAPLGPDDDPDFLQQLSQAARERELREREADLRRREEQLKAGTSGADAEGSGGPQDEQQPPEAPAPR